MTLEATRVAVAQSLKHSAESNLSISKEVELSNQRKGTEHSKAKNTSVYSVITKSYCSNSKDPYY